MPTELTSPLARALLALALPLSVSCASGVADTAFDDLDSAVSVAGPDQEEDEEAGSDDDGWIAEPVLPEAGPSAPPDSGAQSTRDGGVRDAGDPDASGSGADAGRDAGTSGGKDAGLEAGSPSLDAGASGSDAGGGADAGRDSGAQRDSGQGGGGTPGGGGSCDPGKCEGCSVVGPFPCCRENNTCGCTWAPGGYCL